MRVQAMPTSMSVSGLGMMCRALALPELSLSIERLRCGPGLADQLDRLAHHRARVAGNGPALLVAGNVHTNTEAGHVTAVRKMVADCGFGRYLQWIEDRQRPDPWSHPDLLS